MGHSWKWLTYRHTVRHRTVANFIKEPNRFVTGPCLRVRHVFVCPAITYEPLSGLATLDDVIAERFRNNPLSLEQWINDDPRPTEMCF